jgi:biopolymer transport protein ExbD
MIKRKRAGTDVYIPDSSMADIAFLLIIFFMVSTSFSKDKTTVQLPASTERIEIPKNADIISISKAGEIRFNNEEVTMTEILDNASLAMSKNSEQFFIIKADKTVKYELIDEALEQLRQAGVRNISFPTVQEIEE